MSFSENLIKQRNARRLTQEDMAEKVHTGRTTYNRWERGTAVPSLDMIMSLATEFGTTLDELCGFVPNRERKIKPDDELKARLRDMGVKTSSKGDTTIIVIDGLDYGISKRDLPTLIKEADTRYKRLLDSISKGLYQSALAMALNCGVVNSSQQYHNNIIHALETEIEFWIEKHDDKITPEALAQVTKKHLIKMSMKERENVWEQLINDLVTNNTIDPDEYDSDKIKWKCPLFRAHKASN